MTLLSLLQGTGMGSTEPYKGPLQISILSRFSSLLFRTHLIGTIAVPYTFDHGRGKLGNKWASKHVLMYLLASGHRLGNSLSGLSHVALLSVSTTTLDLAPETPLLNSGMCRVGLRYPLRHLLSQKLKCSIKCTIKDQRYGLCNEARHTIR